MTNDNTLTTSRRNVLRGGAIAGGLALGSGLAGAGLNRADAATKTAASATPAELAGPTSAQYWIVLDGVDGESVDVQHKGWIEIEGFEFRATNSGKSSGGGKGAGKVSLQDLHFTKTFDSASPVLFTKCETGARIKSATLAARGNDQKTDYLKIKFEQVLVSSYQQAAADGGAPVESVSLNFTKIKMDYRPQSELG